MKISIIVPVYNSEKYLDKCIDSVISQTYSNWELIIVNDGSLDDSVAIMESFAKRDKRIKIIHQDNRGPGEARNNGLQNATGDYVVFLDSDDYLDEEYLSLLVPKAQNNDIVFIDVNQISVNGRLLQKEKMSKYKSWNKEKIIAAQMTGKILWGGVRKAVSLKLLRENEISFTSHSVGEEALYSFRVLYAASRIAFLDTKAVYYYINHEDSQSKIKMIDPWGGVAETISEYLKDNNMYQQYAKVVNSFRITATVVSIDRITQMYVGKERNEQAKKRVTKFLNSYDKKFGCDIQAMNPKAAIFVPFLKSGCYFPIIICSRIKQLLCK